MSFVSRTGHLELAKMVYFTLCVCSRVGSLSRRRLATPPPSDKDSPTCCSSTAATSALAQGALLPWSPFALHMLFLTRDRSVSNRHWTQAPHSAPCPLHTPALRTDADLASGEAKLRGSSTQATRGQPCSLRCYSENLKKKASFSILLGLYYLTKQNHETRTASCRGCLDGSWAPRPLPPSTLSHSERAPESHLPPTCTQAGPHPTRHPNGHRVQSSPPRRVPAATLPGWGGALAAQSGPFQTSGCDGTGRAVTALRMAGSSKNWPHLLLRTWGIPGHMREGMW